VKQEDDADEAESDIESDNAQGESSNEEVIEGGAPGKAIQTEVTDEEQGSEDTQDGDERIEVRQDFMDRVKGSLIFM
ncbi:hypothetical protein B8X04_17330, partial [Brevibacterium casei]